MRADLQEKLTGFGDIETENVIYQKIYYKLIIVKENPDDEDPDIYGTLNDKRGDKLDFAGFVGSSHDIFLHLDEQRYLQIVFLDNSGQFEVVGGFHTKSSNSA